MYGKLLEQYIGEFVNQYVIVYIVIDGFVLLYYNILTYKRVKVKRPRVCFMASTKNRMEKNMKKNIVFQLKNLNLKT